MSEFINNTNQQLLWNTIQRVQLLHDTIDSSRQTQWFRDIIGLFYKQNINKILNTYELIELNKNTISYMIQSLKPKSNSERTYKEPDPYTMKNNIHVTEPKFKEDMTDNVIENMSELLEQQLKQRELDVINPNNLLEQVAEFRLELKTLSENVKSLTAELLDIKARLSIAEAHKTT